MSDKEAFDLLATDGKLIKRPFFIFDGKLQIGFKEEVWSKLFL
ncbi:hypothetical protein HLPR_08750 [Helicovermis profundi]|uniref:Arsenate reductase n=1 Tax=Helicovermis profundi TaxID=3065157 RepID=A0AAU9EKN0_9FIRM|nr:hypothetical protein HLPR_08750 [Clostridia bacterium S502]